MRKVTMTTTRDNLNSSTHPATIGNPTINQETPMQDSQLSRISNFIWSVADDVLRDLYVRGKYRDVILPMTVLRRLDAVLEPTKQKVLDEKQFLDEAGIADQESVLQQAAGQAFYNSSKFTLKDLTSRATQQALKADFEDYLNGYSSNVQDILDKFEYRNQLNRLSEADALGTLVTRFLSTDINLSPNPVKNEDGSVRLPGLDNHAMGTIFEDLVRRFNEENNEEAGEHWTPTRRRRAHGTARIPARSGPDRIRHLPALRRRPRHRRNAHQSRNRSSANSPPTGRKEVSTHLYGQEINSETYAICKADLLLKGEQGINDHIVGGPQFSTLSNDTFSTHTFDFMLSNPPYGKTWTTDLEKMGGKSKLNDPRFVIQHAGDPDYSLVTRVNDGQMMFLANMASKMKTDTPLGSRIAEVHNGSSLFTGDAGQGESNIRRWIIENDWLEAIVALPLNMFYNTGIATYIWVLTNRKPAHRQGYVQLIDATQWFTPLSKSLGQKRCELAHEDIQRISQAYAAFEETEQSKKFPNAAFGYWKATVERPLRIADAEPDRVYKAAEIQNLRKEGRRDENAPPIIKKRHPASTKPDPLHGLFTTTIQGRHAVVEYEPDPELRDTEQVPLLEDGGVDAFLTREVLPYAGDAWYVPSNVKIGYEINFNRHFYKPQPMRPLDDIVADIIALENDSEGLLAGLLGTQISTPKPQRTPLSQYGQRP